MRLCLLVFAFLATPALAQTPQSADQKAILDAYARMSAAPNPNLQPIEALTCEQMLVEMTAAGRQMSGQLDPSFAANAQALHEQATGKGAPPSADPAAAANRRRFDQLGGQLAGSMQGIDLQRMMALNDRFMAQKCPAPVGPPPH
ncbi:MAG: hypothetical protein ABL956_02495 [Hyphomonadaceae bacterium]